MPSLNDRNYRNIPVAVKIGFVPALHWEFACKDVAVVLIEYVLTGAGIYDF